MATRGRPMDMKLEAIVSEMASRHDRDKEFVLASIRAQQHDLLTNTLEELRQQLHPSGTRTTPAEQTTAQAVGRLASDFGARPFRSSSSGCESAEAVESMSNDGSTVWSGRGPRKAESTGLQTPPDATSPSLHSVVWASQSQHERSPGAISGGGGSHAPSPQGGGQEMPSSSTESVGKDPRQLSERRASRWGGTRSPQDMSRRSESPPVARTGLLGTPEGKLKLKETLRRLYADALGGQSVRT